MKRFKLSPEAANDIREIWSYIGGEGLRAARGIRVKLFDACQKIADHPRIGHRREELTAKPVLFLPVGSYLIVYNPAARPLELVRVLRGARDISGLLSED